MTGNRQERRRRERDAGYRRSDGKSGRRPRMRQVDGRIEEDDYDALERAGFVVARLEPRGRIR